MHSHLSRAHLHATAAPTSSQPPLFSSTQAFMEISSPAFMEPAIPPSGTQTSEYKFNIEASASYSEAFMQSSTPMQSPLAAPISRQSCGAGFTFMETLMPNTSAFMKPPSHLTSMEPLDEFPRHRGFMHALTALGTGDFSANSTNPCAYPPMLKKKEQPDCRNGLSMSRIENSSSRQVTFCKRRNGLFKKAYELSVLCDAEVGAIIFSPSGKLSEFASSSMSHIIKRYQSFQPQMSSNDLLLQDVERWKREAILLNNKLKCLQDFQRCVFEKNNIPFSVHEVQSIESMLEQALDKIRKRKMELIEVETHEIIKKGEILFNENNVLKEKLIQMISMKDCVSNVSSGWRDLHFHQDIVNTKLQLGLDILDYSLQEENSYSSKN